MAAWDGRPTSLIPKPLLDLARSVYFQLFNKGRIWGADVHLSLLSTRWLVRQTGQWQMPS